MKHFMISSDWWTSILAGATSGNPNLDAPVNVATIQRLADRYDIFMIVAPDWHTVGQQVRDRLRAAATISGRTITILRYAGSLSLRWGDPTGAMSVVTVSSAVNTSGVVSNPAWTMKNAGGTPIRSVVQGGSSHLIDYAGTGLIAAAKTHLLGLSDGWDGIFLDEVGATYQGFQLGGTETDPAYPVEAGRRSPNYEAARRLFQSEVTAHLAANGKKVCANINAHVTANGYFPRLLVNDSPGLTHPFIEVFATTWGGAPIGYASPDYAETTELLTWLGETSALGRTPIVNAYTHDAGILRYALSMFLTAAGTGAAFSGNDPAANDEYSTEPAWLPDYDVVPGIGEPSGSSTAAPVRNRPYQSGRVIANTGGTSAVVALGGEYHAPGETEDTTSRTVPAISGVVLTASTTPTTRVNRWTANPAYRVDVSGWTPLRGTTSRQTGGKDGLPYLRLSFPTGTANPLVQSDQVPVTAGETLYLSVWARCNIVTGLVLEAEYYSATGDYVAYDGGDWQEFTTDWSRVSRPIIPPVGAAFVVVTVQFADTSAEAGDVDVTGWLLEDVPGGTFFDDDEPQTPQLTVSAPARVTAGRRVVMAVAEDQTAVTWSQISGIPVSLTTSGVSAKFTAPLTVGVLAFRAMVGAETSDATITVTRSSKRATGQTLWPRIARELAGWGAVVDPPVDTSHVVTADTFDAPAANVAAFLANFSTPGTLGGTPAKPVRGGGTITVADGVLSMQASASAFWANSTTRPFVAVDLVGAISTSTPTLFLHDSGAGSYTRVRLLTSGRSIRLMYGQRSPAVTSDVELAPAGSWAAGDRIQAWYEDVTSTFNVSVIRVGVTVATYSAVQAPPNDLATTPTSGFGCNYLASPILLDNLVIGSAPS